MNRKAKSGKDVTINIAIHVIQYSSVGFVARGALLSCLEKDGVGVGMGRDSGHLWLDFSRRIALVT